MLNKPKKDKPRLNIIIKDLLRKQIIIFMSLGNSNKFIVLSNEHVSNINKALKDIKSDVLADFIQADNKGLIITTNKVISTSNLSIIKKYIKNIDVVDSNNILSLRRSQFKSYFKILSIFYLIKDINIPITSDVVKKVLQFTHIFNDVILVSKLSDTQSLDPIFF